MTLTEISTETHIWSIDRLIGYAGHPRRNESAVDRMCGSIREFGFKIPYLAGSDGELIDGHLRLKAARKLRDEHRPFLMVTDPPCGIELDSEWRDKAGMNGRGVAEPNCLKHRTKGHRETTIPGDTRADWSEAFALVPSLTSPMSGTPPSAPEVLDGLPGIGFLHHQQIIWDKGPPVLTRAHYWSRHEPCWYRRQKNAPWYGKAGQNSTIWDSRSPKFITGGSGEEKFDHPTQKPVELMRKSIRNYTRPGELIYEPLLGSGTTLAAADVTGRVCYGLEPDPKNGEAVVERWPGLTGEKATLEGDRLRFEAVCQVGLRDGSMRSPMEKLAQDESVARNKNVGAPGGLS